MSARVPVWNPTVEAKAEPLLSVSSRLSMEQATGIEPANLLVGNQVLYR